jgi:hypothetical protein
LKSDRPKPSHALFRLRYTILLIILAAIFIVCDKGKQDVEKSDLCLEPHNLAEFLTRLTPEGWVLYDKVGSFTAANLYERINGRAELYLSYDVLSLTIATYERKSNIEDFLEISVYDMGEPTNAFGIFSMERSPGETPIDLGRISYCSDANCYIWKGTYYIIVVASNTTKEFKRLSLEIANKVTTLLSDSGEPVWGRSAFPSDALIPDSVQYFKVDAMGLEFMQDTYTAKYRRGDTKVAVFLSQKESPEAARNTAERYMRYSEKYGQGSKRVTKNGLDLILCDMGGAFDVIIYKERLVCGVLSVPDTDEAVESTLEILNKFQF